MISFHCRDDQPQENLLLQGQATFILEEDNLSFIDDTTGNPLARALYLKSLFFTLECSSQMQRL